MPYEKIKSLREKRGWTLKDLSEKSKVSISYLAELEKGNKNNPSVSILKKISDALEIVLTELIE